MANSTSFTDPRGVFVLVCRGCCCGTDKHPEVDHPAQVAALRGALPPDGRSRLWEVDCLGPCERSNVVVVRAAGTRTWVGGVLDPDGTEALAGWIAGGAATPPPARLIARQFEPDATGVGIIQPLALTAGGIADLVHTVLSDGAGGWSMGVQGAVAEFTFGGDPPQTRRAGRTAETVTPRGGLRLVITDEARAFILTDAPESTKVITLFLAVPRRSLPEPATRVAITAGDGGALRTEDRDGWLIDLGVGHACVNFCIRTGDPDLVGQLRAVEGSTWRDALDRAGADIVERSPHRVVITPLGRAEVYSPIPPPAARPEGPHTHLLPPELELGHELPAGVVLPPGFAVAACFHPPPGWSLTDA